VAQFTQQHFGDRRQLGFGVAHRRERFRVVAGAEVALALDQRIAVRERLRHQHQRFVAGRVAVRVVLADHVTHGAGGFLRLGGGGQAQLAHRVDDPALDRLEAVADERQRAVEHHVHRIVQVGALGVLAQRDLFEAVEGGADAVVGHASILRTGWRPVPGGRETPTQARGLPRLRIRCRIRTLCWLATCNADGSSTCTGAAWIAALPAPPRAAGRQAILHPRRGCGGAMRGQRSTSRRRSALADALAAGWALVLLKLAVGIAILWALWPSLRRLLVGP